jgi:hypothetical protein
MPSSWFKVIILPINYLPVSDCISVRVKIVLVAVDNLPAGFIIGSLGISIPLAIVIIVPTRSISHQSSLKRVPGMLCMAIDVRVRANLLADYPVHRDVVLRHQFLGQFNGPLHCSLLKVPVPACVGLASAISYTHFNTNTVLISAFRVLV